MAPNKFSTLLSPQIHLIGSMRPINQSQKNEQKFDCSKDSKEVSLDCIIEMPKSWKKEQLDIKSERSRIALVSTRFITYVISTLYNN